tara:strand:+ start:3166 stop:3984 length:819 start_codon:yes stop_codon:yes gene_type:complete
MKHIKLASGFEMPMLGLGTWKSQGNDVKNAITIALKNKYTHIDTAWIYQNQNEIGEAIKESGVEREKLFITSKIWREYLNYDEALKNAEETLKQLELDYVDLLLIHWPNKNIPMKDYLTALKKLLDDGKAKSVGVSNFTIHHLQDALKLNIVPISVNQVEYHPYLNQKELLQFCKDNGIALTAYCPLARGEAVNDPLLEEIGKKYNKSAAQVSLRWLHQKDILVIPKSITESRIIENMNIFDFELSNEDMEKIDSLNKDYRICNFDLGEFDY